MTKVEQSPRVRPPLPRLVEQLRILLWMQMFLSVIGVLVCLIAMYYVDRQRLLSSGDAYDRLDHVEARLGLLLLGLIGAAVLLAVCGPLVRRRWPPVHVFVVLIEALAVGIVVLATLVGLAATLLMVLYAALVAWILVDLFRGEVLRHLWRVGG